MTPDAFLALCRALPEPMALVDRSFHVIASNAAARDFSVAPIVPGVCLVDLAEHPPDAGAWLSSCLESRHLLKACHLMRRDDGCVVEVRWEAAAVRQEEGSPATGLVVRFRSRDSGAHEQVLHAVEARYRAMVENAVHGICRCRADGTILDGNPALAGILGRPSVESLIGINLAEQVYEEPVAFLTLVDRIRHAGRVLSVDANWRRLDGSPVAVRLSGRFEGPADTVLELIVEDATERRSLEAQLAQATKMESIGRLAGGIAHDFNNLLTAILGYVDLLQGSLREDDPIGRHAAQIRRAAERASLLTRQLLAFSRKQFLQPRVLDLNAVVAENSEMLRRLISEQIELLVRLDPQPLSVKVDPSQLQQVLMNLAVNARDAMPGGGTLTIETGRVQLDAHALGGTPEFEPGPYAQLVVSDTGVGMDALTRARIFEPFFTTKRVGEGTGLGLSTVYGIVRQSGGHVVVDSERGKGSRFTIYLPAVERAAGAAQIESPAPEGPTGTESVLLVEDDAMVRSLAAEALRLKGYHVLDAGDGNEALAAAQRHAAKIDLLIADVVMPRMTGRELAERLAPLQPGMKVLFMSGYPGNFGGPVASRGADLLEKPFTPGTLVARVRQALDRPPVTGTRPRS
ncbi:MAG TPA: ATP-binding protein [Vicinamibacterales bacterium]